LTVEPFHGAVWEGLGEQMEYQGMVMIAQPDKRQFATNFYQWLSKSCLALVANSLRLMPGGLQNIVQDGFALLSSGDMAQRDRHRTESYMLPLSAEKLVCNIE
jgi:hypothetical protein